MSVDRRNYPQLRIPHHFYFNLVVLWWEIKIRLRRQDNRGTDDRRERFPPIPAEILVLTDVRQLPCVQHAKKIISIVTGEDAMEEFQEFRHGIKVLTR